MSTGQPRDNDKRKPRYIIVQPVSQDYTWQQQRAFESGRAQGACENCLNLLLIYLFCGLVSR